MPGSCGLLLHADIKLIKPGEVNSDYLLLFKENWKSVVASKIIESLRDDLASLHEAGAINKVTMREFDAIGPSPVRRFNATAIEMCSAFGITR